MVTIDPEPASSDTARSGGPIARALAQLWDKVPPYESAAAKEDDAERRHSVRRDGNGDVSVASVATVAPQGTGARCEWFAEHGTAGRLVDLSTTGVSLLFVKPVEINTPILVRLASRDQNHPVDVPAKVVRAVELPHGEWKIVAQFDQPLCFDLAFHLTQNPNA
jgi:hypothetical protein